MLRQIGFPVIIKIKIKIQSQGIDNVQNGKKIEIGGQAKKLQNNLKKWGNYNLNSVIISSHLRILSSQNKFQSLYDKLFKIDKFVE